MDSKFAVVEFLEESSVAVIPEKWIPTMDGVCVKADFYSVQNGARSTLCNRFILPR